VKKLPLEINWEQIRDYQLINLQNGINKVGIPDLNSLSKCNFYRSHIANPG